MPSWPRASHVCVPKLLWYAAICPIEDCGYSLIRNRHVPRTIEDYRGASPIINCLPPRTVIGP